MLSIIVHRLTKILLDDGFKDITKTKLFLVTAKSLYIKLRYEIVVLFVNNSFVSDVYIQRYLGLKIIDLP